MLGIVLIAVLAVSVVATIDWLGKVHSTSKFFVGVEFAYDAKLGTLEELVNDCKIMVDKVKNYSNLFVIGSLEITFNQAALDEVCDYIVDGGLHLIVLFTDAWKYNYMTFDWIAEARQKYGDKFLGVYRYDEPGGNQLDHSSSLLVESGTNYTDVAINYTNALTSLVDYYTNFSGKVFTADYGLYWFDYKAGYSAVFTEFGWNHSRQLHIGLCRGAAKAQNRDWGAIVTWEYDNPPYIESPAELYDDMVLAYKTGAKYLVIFNYAPEIGQYGILTEKHLDKMKDFWNYIHSNPQDYGVIKGEAAYVLPQDYGFGFRYSGDKIWGLWNADDLSPKVWDDVNLLITQYGSRLDVVYDDAEFINAVRSHYTNLFFWNEIVT